MIEIFRNHHALRRVHERFREDVIEEAGILITNYSSTLLYIQGAVFVGKRDQTQSPSLGLLVAPDGNMLSGIWVEDKLHGCGEVRTNDGILETGQFLRGERHGPFTVTFANDSVFDEVYNMGDMVMSQARELDN